MSRVVWRPISIAIIFLSASVQHKQAANVGGSGQNVVKLETTTEEATTSRGLLVSSGPMNFTVQSGTRVTLHCRVDLHEENSSDHRIGVANSIKVCRYTQQWIRRKSTAEKEEIENIVRCRKDSKLLVCLLEDGTVHPCHEPPRVVIVGAGIAGLSAANRLLQCGIDNFVVLEASDRPGGRIHSITMGNIVAEMGADKILGATPMNPVFGLASRERLLPDNHSESKADSICLTSQGTPVSPLVDSTAHFSMRLIDSQAAGLYNKAVAGNKSLWDFVSMRIQQETSLYPEKDRVAASRRMFGMTNNIRNSLAADMSKVPLSQYGSTIKKPGGVAMVPSGMIGVLAPLLRTMPTCDHILYCKNVEKIAWSEHLTGKSDRVKVMCCDGTVYPADYVIVTIPLGVLKEKASSMFVPKLSDEKMNAIARLGFGNIFKVTLEYQNPFWVWKSGTMLLGWSLSELKSRSTCLDWVKGIGNIEETAGTQQGLSIAVSDHEADHAEGLSDVRIAEDVTRVIRKFTGDPTVPYPVNVVKTAWKSNPLFRGSRPYLALGSTAGHQCELALPVPDESKGIPCIFFAGDAQAMGMIGTMHGARMSGIREADRILEMTRKSAGRPRPEQLESPVCKVPAQKQDKIEVKN